MVFSVVGILLYIDIIKLRPLRMVVALAKLVPYVTRASFAYEESGALVTRESFAYDGSTTSLSSSASPSSSSPPSSSAFYSSAFYSFSATSAAFFAKSSSTRFSHYIIVKCFIIKKNNKSSKNFSWIYRRKVRDCINVLHIQYISYSLTTLSTRKL